MVASGLVRVTPHFDAAGASCRSLTSSQPLSQPTMNDGGAHLFVQLYPRIRACSTYIWAKPADWTYPCRPQAKETLFSGYSTRPLLLSPLFYTTHSALHHDQASNPSHTKHHLPHFKPSYQAQSQLTIQPALDLLSAAAYGDKGRSDDIAERAIARANKERPRESHARHKPEAEESSKGH